MPLPGGITTIQVTGTYTDSSGSPLGGAVLFTPSSALVDATGTQILGNTAITAQVSSSTGVMVTQTLPCTNNASLAPPGWTYSVTVAVPGASQVITNVLLPSTLGVTVDMSQISAVSGVLATTGKLFLPDAVSAPGQTTGGGWVYAIGGALYWVGGSGTITKIAPA